jgi:hypothetical protein
MRFGTNSETKVSSGHFDASLGVAVSTVREYAWAFGAIGARLLEIENNLHVQTAVLEAREAGLWRDEWLVVTEVQMVDVLNVVIVKSSRGEGSVSATGTLASPDDVLLVQNASVHFNSSDTFLVESALDTTPLFGLRKVRGVLNRGLKPISGGKRASDELALEREVDVEMFPE